MICRLAPTLLFLLAACDVPYGEDFPSRKYTVKDDSRVYSVKVQRDWIDFSWGIVVTVPALDLGEDDRATIVETVLPVVGSDVCGSGGMALATSKNFYSDDNAIQYLPDIGAFRMTAICT